MWKLALYVDGHWVHHWTRQCSCFASCILRYLGNWQNIIRWIIIDYQSSILMAIMHLNSLFRWFPGLWEASHQRHNFSSSETLHAFNPASACKDGKKYSTNIKEIFKNLQKKFNNYLELFRYPSWERETFEIIRKNLQNDVKNHIMSKLEKIQAFASDETRVNLIKIHATNPH